MHVSRPALLIHGGAGSRSQSHRTVRIRQRLRTVCEQAYEVLEERTALETVVFAVRQLEDDPLFNAGTGSVLQRDGKARMSAAVMDGSRQRFAAVINIERVKNPILVARALFNERETVLAAAGALRFARAKGCGPWDPVTDERRHQWRKAVRTSHGTVGAVAVDRHGRLAAATSSGGRPLVMPGRVSDSGMPVGNYANKHAALSCTGVGEDIMDEALAVRIAQRVLDGRPLRQAMSQTLRELARRKRLVAVIGVDCAGHLVWGATLPALFAVGRTGRRVVESF